MPASMSKRSVFDVFRKKKDHPDDITLETNFAKMLKERAKGIDGKQATKKKKKNVKWMMDNDPASMSSISRVFRVKEDHPDDITLETAFAEMLEDEVKGIDSERATEKEEARRRADRDLIGAEIVAASDTTESDSTEDPRAVLYFDVEDSVKDARATFTTRDASERLQGVEGVWESLQGLLYDMLFGGLDEVDDRTAADSWDSAKDTRATLATRDALETFQGVECVSESLGLLHDMLFGGSDEADDETAADSWDTAKDARTRDASDRSRSRRWLQTRNAALHEC